MIFGVEGELPLVCLFFAWVICMIILFAGLIVHILERRRRLP